MFFSLSIELNILTLFLPLSVCSSYLQFWLYAASGCRMSALQGLRFIDIAPLISQLRKAEPRFFCHAKLKPPLSASGHFSVLCPTLTSSAQPTLRKFLVPGRSPSSPIKPRRSCASPVNPFLCSTIPTALRSTWARTLFLQTILPPTIQSSSSSHPGQKCPPLSELPSASQPTASG